MARVLSTLPAFVRDTLTTVLTQGWTLAVSMANAAIIARALGPTGKGQLSLLTAVPALLALALGFGVGLANAYHAGTGRFAKSALVSNTVAMALISTAAAAILGALSISTGLAASALPGVPTPLLILACLALPLSLLESGLMGTLQGMQRIARTNAAAVAKGLAYLLVTLLLVGIWRLGLVGAVGGYLAGCAVAVLVLLLMLRPRPVDVIPRWRWSVLHPSISFGVQGQVGNLLQFFNYRLDVFVVNLFLGPASVGIYSAAVSVAELLWQLPGAIGFVIFPRAASTSRDTMNRFTPPVFRATLAVTFLGALSLLAFGRFLIRLIFSVAFVPAYGPLVLLLPGVVLLGGAKVISNELAGRGKPLVNSVNALVSLVVTIALDFVLIPRHGVAGAAIASTVSYAVTFLVAVACFVVVSGQTLSALFWPTRADLAPIQRMLGRGSPSPNSSD